MNDHSRFYTGNAVPVVKVIDHFDAHDMFDLVDGNVIGLRWPDFYPAELCGRFASLIMRHRNIEHYAVAPDIKKIGKAIFDAASEPTQLEEYYRISLAALDDLRNFFAPYLAPMDKLRLILQERWPAGSMIENLHGLPMFCGLIRAFEEGAEARPHQDMTHWDVPTSWPAKSLLTQIATNIYISTAEEGGELELWAYGISDSKNYNEAQVAGDYGLDREKIGLSVAKIKPKQGDLIMFDARKIHAVNRNNRGVRIAVSAFIGYRGPAFPLTLYS